MSSALQERIGALPLAALEAVVFDTETTGPDAASDRIVQIGAVRIGGGEIRAEETFQQLVDPGIPIPPGSTQIHGISDADIRGQPGFAAAFEAFEAFRAGAPVIGHSVGFDLAILKRECALAGLEWHRPRALDTRMLARVVRPSLTNHDLEVLAGWLGVTVTGRHTALGDALATAAVFLGLVPHLREKNVRTLSEAEARSRNLSSESVSLQAAGWEDPGAAAPSPRQMSPLARIDSYPFSHRVSEVMNEPPALVDGDMTLGELLKMLMELKISSVFVGTKAQVLGIVTERDVLRAIASAGAAALQDKASVHMSAPVQRVNAQAFIYRAIGRISRLNLRHLAVEDENGQVVGALSARDLLKLRAGDALMLGDEIELAGDGAALAAAWANIPVVAEQLAGEEVDVRTIAAVISREMCAMTRRAAELAEQRMIKEGEGPAPVPYAVLVLGSGGRGESLLAADQDNAIVYGGEDEDGPADAWFARLGELMAETLDVAGIKYCSGGIMAKNKSWRHTVGGWKALVAEWVTRSRPEDLLNIDIFYDMRAVYGDARLADQIRGEAFRLGSQANAFLKLLAETASQFRPPLGFMGRLQTRSGRVDLKLGGLLPIVTAARVLAIRHGVLEHATPARLAGLAERGIGVAADFDTLTRAHRRILRLILNQQIVDIHAGRPLSNSVETGPLSRSELGALKEALRDISNIDYMIQDLLFAKPAGQVS